MALGKYRFIPKGRYFCPHENVIKTRNDVRRERAVVLWVLICFAVISVGLPFMVNLGKELFAIQPVIY